MSRAARAVFGARGQIVVSGLMLAATAVQWAYWSFVTPPTVVVVFQVSMEALAYAAFASLAGALGYRATERVEEHVVNNPIEEERP